MECHHRISDANDCTTHIEVMYDCIFLDHHPVLVKADLNILAEFEQEHSNYLKRHIHWENSLSMLLDLINSTLMMGSPILPCHMV